MNLVDRLLHEYDREVDTTRKLLNRLPDDAWDWKPHAKSMTLGRLASHVAELSGWSQSILEEDELDLMSPEMQGRTGLVLTSLEAILETFSETTSACRTRLASMTDESLDETWTMRMGETVISSDTRYVVFRQWLLNHLVHHRAQLGVFLRLLDVPLPGAYGPSADERG